MSVKYYYGLEDEACCTLSDLQIEDVVDEYNLAQFKPSDTVTLYTSSSILIEDETLYDFLSAKL